MKKLTSIICAALFSTLAFGNFFGPRFFEMSVSAPFSVTNNLFMLDDIMKKNAVLDLGQMADNLPKSGFNVIVNSNPNYKMNINIKDLHIGLDFGIDSFGKFTLSKDLIDFIGNGNELYDDVEIAANITSDIFIHSGFRIESKFGRYKFAINPCLFAPLAHITTGDSHITFFNHEDGSMGIDMLSEIAVYTNTDLSAITNGLDTTALYNGIGFDFGSSCEYIYSDLVTFTGSFRMPMVPGHLSSVSYSSMSMNLETKLSSFTGGDFGELKPTFESGLAEKSDYSIHRPFKLNFQADMKPLGNLLIVTTGLGLGVRNPFSVEHHAFAEYYFGCKFASIGIIQGTLSTEYTDEVFKHQISGLVNLRLFQLELGMAAASASFASSFKGSGFSAYVVTTWGF